MLNFVEEYPSIVDSVREVDTLSKNNELIKLCAINVNSTGFLAYTNISIDESMGDGSIDNLEDGLLLSIFKVDAERQIPVSLMDLGRSICIDECRTAEQLNDVVEFVRTHQIETVISSPSFVLEFTKQSLKKGYSLSLDFCINAFVFEQHSCSYAMEKNLQSIWSVNNFYTHQFMHNCNDGRANQMFESIQLGGISFSAHIIEQVILANLDCVLAYRLVICEQGSVVICVELEESRINDKRRTIVNAEAAINKALNVDITVISMSDLEGSVNKVKELGWIAARVTDARE